MNTIDVQPYLDKLDKLKEYMEYSVSFKSISLPHKFYTYTNLFVRDYFIESFEKLGFKIYENNMVKYKLSFEEYLQLNN